MKVDVKFKLVDRLSNRDFADGFKYLWLKHVIGFDDSNHCAKCLMGYYIKGFKPEMMLDEKHSLILPADEVLYFCGVSQPFKMENNLHAPVKVQQGTLTVVKLYNGLELVVENAAPIDFDDEAARQLYSLKGERFLSCRNFQFGADYFRKS